MTCAKKRVLCALYDAAGMLISIGRNSCDNPQEVCPREPGEDYTKCSTVCEQRGHAEVIALRNAGGYDLFGGKAVITHHRVCEWCERELMQAGIANIELVP